MTSTLAAAMILALIAQSTDTSADQRATVLVLDASGSMWAQLPEGRSRIEVAREVLSEFLDERDAAVPLGVVAYGYRRKGDCSDIEVIADVAVQPADELGPRLRALMPLGKTPIAEALRKAAAMIPPTAESAEIVLVTDGLETCGADPCAVAAELAAAGIPIRAHVVGFGLGEGELAQMTCIAEATGGLLLAPRTGEELRAALTQAESGQGTAPTPVAEGPSSELIAPGDAAARSRIRVQWTLAPGTPVADPGRGDRLVWAPAQEPDSRGVFAAEVAATNDGEAEIPTPETDGPWVLRLERWPAGASDWVALATDVVEVGELAFVIEGPEQLQTGEAFELEWQGPAGDSDWIGIWPADTDRTGQAISAAEIEGTEGAVALAASVVEGAYEIRLITEGIEGRTINARLPLTVAPAEIEIRAPAEVAPGETIVLDYRGPAGGDSWIDITRPGETAVWGGGYSFGGYAYPRDAEPVDGWRRIELAAPDQPGDYAIRVVLSVEDRRPVFWQALQVRAPGN